MRTQAAPRKFTEPLEHRDQASADGEFAMETHRWGARTALRRMYPNLKQGCGFSIAFNQTREQRDRPRTALFVSYDCSIIRSGSVGAWRNGTRPNSAPRKLWRAGRAPEGVEASVRSFNGKNLFRDLKRTVAQW